MSASMIDFETLHKPHGGVPRGIAAVVISAALLFFAYLTGIAEDGETPVDPETRIDARGGDEGE